MLVNQELSDIEDRARELVSVEVEAVILALTEKISRDLRSSFGQM